jgi:recombination protein RecT
MANEIVKSFSEGLTDKLVAVENALPKDFNRERFVQNCLAVLNEKPELTRINAAELQAGLLKGAYLGLDFFQKECYLIPYGNKVNFQTDYKGETKFVKKYAIRPIHEIYAKIVRDGDLFEEKIIDGKPSIEFHPKPFNTGEIVGAFAVALYKDGGMDYEVMTTQAINGVRSNYSKMSNSGAWKNSWDEMAKKTVLRRLCKHIETDFESTEAMKAWEDGSDSNIATVERSGEVVDAFAEHDIVDVDFKEVENE